MSSLGWLDEVELPSPRIEQLKSQLTQVDFATDPLGTWQYLTQHVLSPQLPLDVHRKLWQHTFADWDPADRGPWPMWIPSRQVIDRAHVTRWMVDLGLADYSQLHHWSVDHRDQFWQKAIDDLGIVFRQPPKQIMDDSAGPANTSWLAGARLNIVESCFQADPDATAIVTDGDESRLAEVTYGQLRQQTNLVSSSLRAAGFQPGDSIAVVMPMTRESVAIYLGIIQAGCVAVSIADSFAAPEIASRLRIAQAKGVFTYNCLRRADKQIDLYGRVKASDAPHTVVLSLPSSPPPELRSDDALWEDFLQGGEHFDPHLAGALDPINILFSSGTTGDPKAIPWNHTTPIKCAADGFLHHDLHVGDVVVWPTNLVWMMGPWLIFASLINKGTIGLYGDVPTNPGFGQFVQDANVSMLGVVPTIVANWRATGCMETFDWTAIRAFSSTGETSHPEDMFYLSSLAGYRPIIEYCGGTEIGGGYITSTVVQPNAPSTFSTPAMGLDVVLLDESHQAADEGELFLVPPSIGLSDRLLQRDHHQTYYAGAPSGPEGVVLRRHGDHFRRLPGDIFVAGGRVDDTMNLGGIKISSAEIEKVLNRLPAVRETAAVAVPLEDRGPERLVIFVVPSDPAAATDELREAMNGQIKQQLNPLFKIDRVVQVAQLPRTASNKVMRRELRAGLVQSEEA